MILNSRFVLHLGVLLLIVFGTMIATAEARRHKVPRIPQTNGPTKSPTSSPTMPTSNPTMSPTTPTNMPTTSPTKAPTKLCYSGYAYHPLANHGRNADGNLDQYMVLKTQSNPEKWGFYGGFGGQYNLPFQYVTVIDIADKTYFGVSVNKTHPFIKKSITTDGNRYITSVDFTDNHLDALEVEFFNLWTMLFKNIPSRSVVRLLDCVGTSPCRISVSGDWPYTYNTLPETWRTAGTPQKITSCVDP